MKYFKLQNQRKLNVWYSRRRWDSNIEGGHYYIWCNNIWATTCKITTSKFL